MVNQENFSDNIAEWLKSKGKKDLNSLGLVFGQKSFAIAVLLLMSPAALPIPTGGITHIFEIASMILAIEMIIGLQIIWLPKKMQKYEIKGFIKNKTLPLLINKIRYLERFSRPRFSDFVKSKNFGRLAGIFLFLASLLAFIAPPFSGLDTLPALGAVIFCLGVILGDIILGILGFVVLAVGAALIFALGSVTANVFKIFFR